MSQPCARIRPRCVHIDIRIEFRFSSAGLEISPVDATPADFSSLLLAQIAMQHSVLECSFFFNLISLNLLEKIPVVSSRRREIILVYAAFSFDTIIAKYHAEKRFASACLLETLVAQEISKIL